VQIRFGPFILDLDTRQLLRTRRRASAPAAQRRDEEIHLSPKAFDLLAALALERPNVLSKATLQERLWPETFVAEANLSNLIAEVRDAIDDRARAPRFIRTVHGFGYAFLADATSLPSARDTPPDRPACWIQWGDRRFPLTQGEHVIGRDPDVAIRLDASTVSRRHARLVVTATGTMLEDFDSKNGTYRAGERVTSSVTLADGDEIRIGSVLVTFHMRTPFASTETQVAGAQ
jgi:DNA-binding winged helix-turn-helix (wHTH) protein